MSVGDQGFGSFRAPVETASSIDGTASFKVRMACEDESRSECGDDSGSAMHVESCTGLQQSLNERGRRRELGQKHDWQR